MGAGQETAPGRESHITDDPVQRIVASALGFAAMALCTDQGLAAAVADPAQRVVPGLLADAGGDRHALTQARGWLFVRLRAEPGDPGAARAFGYLGLALDALDTLPPVT